MGIVIGGMTVSLDGFVNDRDGSIGLLYPNMDDFAEADKILNWIGTTGAVIMGRRNFDMAQGDWTGYEFQTPIFVLTHHPPTTPIKGENENLKIHFVTGGVESAIAQAKAAAGDKNVMIVGGPDVTHQCLQSGLIDEVHLGIVPVLLGGGLRMFEPLDSVIKLEKIRVIETSGGLTELLYRVVKA
jgi:dihydrofolate reductase